VFTICAYANQFIADLSPKDIPMSSEPNFSSMPSLALDGNTATGVAQQFSLPSYGLSSIFRVSSQYSPLYSQCGDLLNSIVFLSRSLRRMNVDHAITGAAVLAMESSFDQSMSYSSVEPLIELVLSGNSYEHFLKSCVHQQIKPIEGEDRMFWDNRTGCTVRIYLTGESMKVGHRSIVIPALNGMTLNAEGIKSWNIEQYCTQNKSLKRQTITKKAATQETKKKKTVIAA
jgi:hypothetical protein